MQIKVLLTKIKSGLINGLTILFAATLIFNLVSVPVSAQVGGGPSGLGACSPESLAGDASGGSAERGASALVGCFQQISVILIIFGVIIGGILAARDSLFTFLPSTSTDAAKNFRERVYGLVIGIILISLPGSILSIFNPATTGIDIFSGLSSLRPATTDSEEEDSTTTDPDTTTDPGDEETDPTEPGENPGDQQTPGQGDNLLPTSTVLNITRANNQSTNLAPNACQQIPFTATTSGGGQPSDYQLKVCNNSSNANYENFSDILNISNNPRTGVSVSLKPNATIRFNNPNIRNNIFAAN